MPEAVAPVAPAPVAPAAAKPAPTTVPVQPAAKAPATAETKTPPAPAELHEVVINGQKVKKTLTELIRDASKVGHASGVAQQAKEALRVLKEREAKIKADESIWDDDARLEAELAKRGKLDKLARKRLEEKYNESQQTPEQQEAAKARAEAEAAKKALADRDEADKKTKQAALDEQAKNYVSKTLAEAAERAGMPKNVDAFEACQKALADFVELGLPYDPDRIVETALENLDGAFKRLEESATKGLKGAALKARLGPVVWKEVLRFAAEEHRNGGGRPQPIATPKPAPPAPSLNPQDLAAKYRGAQ